jgi:hypothetical protein
MNINMIQNTFLTTITSSNPFFKESKRWNRGFPEDMPLTLSRASSPRKSLFITISSLFALACIDPASPESLTRKMRENPA